MDIKVTGRKTTVTDALRDRVNEKIGSAISQFDFQPTSVDVVLRVERYKSSVETAVCEVTCRYKGNVIRVSAAKEDMYAAIDEAARMVTRKIRKFKTRVIERRQHPHGKGLPKIEPTSKLADQIIADEQAAAEDDDQLVRTKYVEYTKLTEEDALVQADLLGHDFFVFRDMVSDNVHVIYHRRNGGYGIIKPESERN